METARRYGRLRATTPVGALAFAALIAAASAALGHTGGSTGYAAISVDGNAVRFRLTLSPPGLPAPVAEDLVRARSGQADSRARLIRQVQDKVRIAGDGRACEPAQGSIDPSAPEVESVTLVVDYACPAPVRTLAIRDNLFDVLGGDHHTLAKVEWPGGLEQLALEPNAREARVAMAVAAEADPGGAGFFSLGVEHILTGYDHLLFLAALLLRGGGIASIFKIITAFTVAHSITLALAALHVVVLPPQLIEPVIAASIVWVAVDNVWRRSAVSHRWLVSFVFGLVHGFGFAAALEPLALPGRRMAWALLGFNLGVEAGQALMVLALLPLLAYMRGKAWEAAAVRAASLAVAAVGLVWLVERLAA